MSFFENVSKKMAETGQAAMQKARAMSETTRLNMQANDLEKNIREAYARIGEQYFKLHAGDPEDALAGFVQDVREANDQLVKCREAIAKLSNDRTCPSCGAALDKSAAFCPACGAPVPKDEPEARPEPGSICGTCGAELIPGNRFCTKCGTPVPDVVPDGPSASEFVEPDASEPVVPDDPEA